ncbi:ribonucleoside-triphosphate reductase, adenosylcobalamin-dependent, partial [Salmonella enterica subsp. enterica serovar Enteritidis]|nr:ribonucleoside-triphosphate reductase, adenosylcobalamin-dependent [Salmonella enterica subsp. enterica serovar Enteritidis]
IIKKNRRIGISMSGIQDWFLDDFGHRVVSGFEPVVDPHTGKMVEKPIYDPEIKQAVDGLYRTVVNADKDYSEA